MSTRDDTHGQATGGSKDGIPEKKADRPVGQSGEVVEAAPTAADALDGQMGPDEISDADEVVKNQEAKRHL